MKAEQQNFRFAQPQLAGAERRQKLAHGTSRGFIYEKNSSPGGAKETGGWICALAGRVFLVGNLLSPLTGLDLLSYADPRLTPWATVCRHSVAFQ